MTTNPQQESLFVQSHKLQQSIGLLAELGASKQPLLSFYLDLAKGPLGAWDQLHERTSALRSSLPKPIKAQVDASMRDIETRLMTMPEQVRGMAIFTRDDGPRSVLMPVPLAVPCETRLSIAGAADISPLVRLANDYGRFLLIWARADSIQVTEVDLGTTSLRAWSATPHLVSSDGAPRNGSEPDATRNRFRRSLRAYRAVERQLRSNRHLPMVLAGEPGLIPLLRARFNRSLRSRLAAQVEVLPDQPYAEVVQCALVAFSAYRRHSAVDLGNHLVRSLEAGRSAVAGCDATLMAICDGSVDTLVIIDDVEPICCEYRSGEQTPDQATASRHERAELIRLAVRFGIPVELVGEDHALRHHGGVGCLLKRPSGLGAESMPRQANGLPLVA